MIVCLDGNRLERAVQILHDACCWNDVFKYEFLPEQINNLHRSGTWGRLEDTQLSLRERTSWLKGRDKALEKFGEENWSLLGRFGQPRKCRLKARHRHNSMPDCPECANIRGERIRLRKECAPEEQLKENSLRAKAHRDFFMNERYELEHFRLQSNRGGSTCFFARDKCGDDCLYLPSMPRHLASNQGLYRYRMAAQIEVAQGQLLNINLLPPSLVTGANFSATSLLHTINDLMDANIITKDTERFVVNHDGGSEYVNWPVIGTCCTLLHEGVIKELLDIRLPSEHHHEYVDLICGVLEGGMKKAGFTGVDTPMQLRDHFARQFSTSNVYRHYKTKVHFQMANYNIEDWLSGCDR